MVPKFNKLGNLPPGIHNATWQEVCDRFGGTGQRDYLLDGLKKLLIELKLSGCLKVYLNGSFVTNKEYPNDYDFCWEPDNVNFEKLDPILLDDPRWTANKIKEKYLGDVIRDQPRRSGAGITFFQEDRNGNKKGIVMMNLRECNIDD